MYGILVVDKPKGLTSNDVVTKIKHTFLVKVGHGGTLDPLATGVLPLLIGDATKVASYLLHDFKEYQTVIRLGQKTTTLDAEGEIIEEHELPNITIESFKKVLTGFIGKQKQVPPAFSSIKIKGKRAYELARKGQDIRLPERAINVYHIEIIDFSLPFVTLKMKVSGGTYIRSLVRDIGEKLGYGAHVKELRRLTHGVFSIEQAISLDELLFMSVSEFKNGLLPIYSAFPSAYKIIIDPFSAWLLFTGKSLIVSNHEDVVEDMVIFMGEDGRELGFGVVMPSGIKPIKIFGNAIQSYMEKRRKTHV